MLEVENLLDQPRMSGAFSGAYATFCKKYTETLQPYIKCMPEALKRIVVAYLLADMKRFAALVFPSVAPPCGYYITYSGALALGCPQGQKPFIHLYSASCADLDNIAAAIDTMVASTPKFMRRPNKKESAKAVRELDKYLKKQLILFLIRGVDIA